MQRTPARPQPHRPQLRIPPGRRGTVLLAVAALTAAGGAVAVLANRPDITSVPVGRPVTLQAESGAELTLTMSLVEDPYGRPGMSTGGARRAVPFRLQIENVGRANFYAGWQVEARLADQNGSWFDCERPDDNARGSALFHSDGGFSIDAFGFIVAAGQDVSVSAACWIPTTARPSRLRVALQHDGDAAEWRLA